MSAPNHEGDAENLLLRDTARMLGGSARFLRRAATMLPGSTEWRRQVRQAMRLADSAETRLRSLDAQAIGYINTKGSER